MEKKIKVIAKLQAPVDRWRAVRRQQRPFGQIVTAEGEKLPTLRVALQLAS